mmetsp:Transcript_31731/g.34078  ORF Transcript_31731/g.34078 Transcript_31731/m.34078 type:complete len:169 (+) Transcript_31731:202-708(+)
MNECLSHFSQQHNHDKNKRQDNHDMHGKEDGTGKHSSSSRSSRRRSRRDDEECDSEIYDTAHRIPLRLAGTLFSPTPAAVANCGTTVLEFPSFIHRLNYTTLLCLISPPRSSFSSFYSTSVSVSASISGPTNSSLHQSRGVGNTPAPPSPPTTTTTRSRSKSPAQHTE